MKKFIHFSDFLGYQPSLMIEGNERFSTVLSGLMSIVVILLTILCTIYFGWDLVFKSQPTVLITNQVYNDFGPLNMSSQGFNFIFAIQNANYTYNVDPSIFEVSATYIINKNVLIDGQVSQVLQNKQVPIDLCSTYYTNQDILERNIQFPLNLFYCLKPNAVELRGFWGTEYYSTVVINVNKCVNTTINNNKCQPQDVIDNTIQGSYISIDMTTFSVDQTNYTDPLQRIFANSYNLLNANSSLQYAYHIYPVVFQSDDGLMLQDNQLFHGWDTKTTLFNVISRTDNIVTLTFEGYSSGPVYIRNYIKLQTVITQVGGFIKAIMLIAKIICHFLTQGHYFVHFMAENNISCERKKTNILQPGVSNCAKNKSNNFMINPDNSMISNNIKIEKENIISKDRIVRTTTNYIFSQICICRKKQIFNYSIDHTKNIFTNFLGVEHMVRRFIEFEKTKLVLTDIHKVDYSNNLKDTFGTKIKEQLDLQNNI